MRESGWYWVKFSHTDLECARWESGFDQWWVSQCEDYIDDDQLQEVDERRIVREV